MRRLPSAPRIASGACIIVHTQLDAGVVAEGELVEVALEVLLAAMLVDASETALEYAKKSPRKIVLADEGGARGLLDG